MHFDLIIVGGGMVGASLAAALGSIPLKVALIEARRPQCDDPRLLALNASTCQFLKNIDLWDGINSYAAAIHEVHVSRQGYFGSVCLNRKDAHLPSLGYVIPAYHIENTLYYKLQDIKHCTSFQPAQVFGLSSQNNLTTLQIKMAETGEEITLSSPIIIGADGSQSTLRTLLNIPVKHYDYQQSALVGRVLLNRSHYHNAYERFTPDGALAMLPLMGNECAMIWTASHQRIAELKGLPKESLLKQIQTVIGYRLGHLKDISHCHQFPLQMLQAEKNVISSPVSAILICKVVRLF